MESLIPNQKGMTSLEIAEVTGKQHAHVMRDIRNLLSQGVAESNFGLGSYTDANGQERPLFNLTPKGCLILASGYDAVLREKIIDRLEYLENEKKAIQTPQTYLEALEALVASEKEKERLRIESEQQKKQIEQKDAKIAKIQPKADFADAAFKKILFSFGSMESLRNFIPFTDDDCIRYVKQAVKLLISYMGFFYALIGYWRLPLRKIIVFALVANAPSVNSVKCNRFLFDKVATYNFL
jgi:Rha family phage regulatory protein